MKKEKLLLGAHMSIAGGVQNSLYDGASIGCTAVQIFTHSNRQWKSKEFTQEEFQAFKEAQKSTGIDSVIAHASYLINLGSDSPEIVKKSYDALKNELLRCSQLGISYLVLHPGSSSNKTDKECMNQISKLIDEVIEESNVQVSILIENTAGQGSSVGHTFEQLAFMRQEIKQKKKIGFCFDTCHAWAASYDFSTRKSYEAMWKHFDDVVGREHLKAMHLNDSLKALGSRVDRHADIGKGTIGLEAFRLIMNDNRLSTIAKVLETPSHELNDYKKNLDLLKSLIRT